MLLSVQIKSPLSPPLASFTDSLLFKIYLGKVKLWLPVTDTTIQPSKSKSIAEVFFIIIYSACLLSSVIEAFLIVVSAVVAISSLFTVGSNSYLFVSVFT